MVLFGATGDLTRRKLLPAIYSLTADGLLPCGLPIVSVGRRARSREELLDEFRQRPWARPEASAPEIWDAMARASTTCGRARRSRDLRRGSRCLRRWTPPGRAEPTVLPRDSAPLLRAHTETPAKRPGAEATGDQLADRRRSLRERRTGQRAQPPTRGDDESQIFRMDHYLGRRRCNILVLRFANSLRAAVEPEVHRQRADHDGRDSGSGPGPVLRPQRHAPRRDQDRARAAALVAMEPPCEHGRDSVQDEGKADPAIRRLAREIARNTAVPSTCQGASATMCRGTRGGRSLRLRTEIMPH